MNYDNEGTVTKAVAKAALNSYRSALQHSLEKRGWTKEEAEKRVTLLTTEDNPDFMTCMAAATAAATTAALLSINLIATAAEEDIQKLTARVKQLEDGRE